MKIAFFSSALLVANTAMGATPINGWYSSLFGGANYLFDNIHVIKHDFERTRASYDFGYVAGGRLGFQNSLIRYEAEVTYLNADIKRFRINDIPQRRVRGDANAVFGMANVYYDFPDMVPAISPFLGVGLGYGWVEGRLGSCNVCHPHHPLHHLLHPFHHPFDHHRPIDHHGSSSVFAYQTTFGFTYNFEENYALNIAYRYIGTTRVDALGKVFQANLGTVGIIYRFNEHIYK